MRSLTHTHGTTNLTTEAHADSTHRRFDRLASRLHMAGLVWAQAEPSHLRWSSSEDCLTTLVAGSPWMRRQVDAAVQRWMDGNEASPSEPWPVAGSFRPARGGAATARPAAWPWR